MRRSNLTKIASQKTLAMTRNLHITSIYIFLFLSIYCFDVVAQEDELDDGELRQRNLKIQEFSEALKKMRNPFVSQLPPPPPKPAPVPSPTPPVSNNTSPADNHSVQTTPSGPKAQDMASGINVSGIVWNTTRPQAIVNEKIVSVGDKVNDFEIKAIKKSGVVFKILGQSVKVPLKK